MKVQCPKCGDVIVVSGLGRKAFNLPVIKVCNALQAYRSVTAAAESLGCSRALIYKVLKANGLKAADVIKGHATKDTRKLYKGALSDGQR